MKKLSISIAVLLLFGASIFASEVNYSSISILNSSNLAVMFEKYLGYLYDSHGCLHFTPSDIYQIGRASCRERV